MKFERSHYLGVIFGVALAISSFLFFRGSFRYFLLVIALIIGLLPLVFTVMSFQGVKREKEEMFLAFSRDLVENVRSGTPISKSILNLKDRNYGPLSPHVQKLANQLGLGINLTLAFATFAKDAKSESIARSVALISEAEKAGGKIETILESVTLSVNQIENLKKERRTGISNLITQGYIIFLVFIVIMLVLEFKILPLVSNLSGNSPGLNVEAQKIDPSEFSTPLFVMILVQSFFAGLVIGKISEGSVRDGIKHSFILLVITLLMTTGARVLFKT